MTSSITFTHVSKSFPIRAGRDPDAAHEVAALDDISLDVAAGEFSVLVGPSGCGKSTLLDLLAGLSTPSSGTIDLDGTPIRGPGVDRGVVFQQYALLPWRSARGNVEFGLEAVGLSRRERRQRAEHYLDLVGLAGFADRHPHELSGGMKQRVAIAIALVCDPDVIVMDEPTTALDLLVQREVLDQVMGLRDEFGFAIIFTTHDLALLLEVSDTIAVMQRGRLVEYGAAMDVYTDPRHPYTQALLRSLSDLGALV